jgi:hypothetical protein
LITLYYNKEKEVKNMKKKNLLTLLLIPALVGCNGTAITKEKAQEIANNIDSYQEGQDNLYPNGMKIEMEETSNNPSSSSNSKYIYEIYETDDANSNNYLHVYSLINSTSNSSTTTVEHDEYYGVIDKKYVYVNNIDKTYTTYSSVTSFNLAFTGSSIVCHLYMESLSGEALVSFIDDIGDSDEATYKSSGSSNLYVQVTATSDSKIITKEMTFNKNIIASEKETTQKLENGEVIASVSTSIKCSYKVSKKMPSIKNYTAK